MNMKIKPVFSSQVVVFCVSALGYRKFVKFTSTGLERRLMCY